MMAMVVAVRTTKTNVAIINPPNANSNDEDYFGRLDDIGIL